MAGDGDLPGKTITDVELDGTNSTGDIMHLTRYDAEGRVIETRQPSLQRFGRWYDEDRVLHRRRERRVA